MTSAAPLFSVITVCRNAAPVMAQTARSLKGQVFGDYEWLVIDGASSDATCAIAHEAGIPRARIVSEPDKGIYDAMNKGIRLASGGWIYFLNAGDELHDPQVLSRIAKQIASFRQAELFWGNVLYTRGGSDLGLIGFSHVSRAWLLFEDLNHQAVFAHRALFGRLGAFNDRFPRCADYDWLLRVFRQGAVAQYVNATVARYDADGFHAKDIEALSREREELRLQYCSPLQLKFGLFGARIRRRWRLARQTMASSQGEVR